jgi:exodeoxyribonuclease VII large subunit
MLKSNILEYGVAEFSQVIKKKIEASFEYLIIKGEITGYKPHGSGHFYFNLKENDCVLNAVCFKGKANKINFAFENTGDDLTVLFAERFSSLLNTLR